MRLSMRLASVPAIQVSSGKALVILHETAGFGTSARGNCLAISVAVGAGACSVAAMCGFALCRRGAMTVAPRTTPRTAPTTRPIMLLRILEAETNERRTGDTSPRLGPPDGGMGDARPGS